MASFATSNDVQNILKDLRKIVVELREDEKISQSLTYAIRVTDIIRRMSGDTVTHHIPGQDYETEHKNSRNRQLRDLDNENRHLRRLYEDSQWTFYIVMEAHRRISKANFGKDNDVASLKKRIKIDENKRKKFCFHAAMMAKEIHDCLERKEKMNLRIRKRIEDLTAENDLLRSILGFESGVDIQTITDHLKKRTIETPLKSVEDDSESCSERKCLVDRDEQPTPGKKQYH